MDDKIEMDKVLSESCIDLSMDAKSKDEAILKLVEMLYEEGKISSIDGFLKDIYKREEAGATGIGEGIAIPHGKSSYVEKTSIAIGRITNYIPWESLDDKPVRVIILFAVRDIDKSKHVKLLSNVAIMLCREEVIDRLFTTNDRREVIDLFSNTIG